MNMRFQKIIWLFVVSGAFTLRASGQAQTPEVPIVVSPEYFAAPKVLILHLLNNSGKDITGYSISIGHRLPNGTMDKSAGWTTTTTDMLSQLIEVQMAANATVAEQIRQNWKATGSDIFEAGETRDMTLTAVKSDSEFDGVVEAVFYADGTFYKHDNEAFKQMLSNRQLLLQGKKESIDVAQNALADTSSEPPVADAMAELKKRSAAESQNKGPWPELGMDISMLQSVQRPQKDTTERERLTRYVEEQEKKIELMTPHCHLEVVLK
jgi:hypothetical protein